MSKVGSWVMRIIGVLFFLFILFLGVGFSSLNSEPVSVNYYIGSFTLPLSVVAVSAFSLGVVCALVLSFLSLIGLRVRVARLRRDLRRRDEEITSLRRPAAKAAA